MSPANDSSIPVAFQKLIVALDLALFPLRHGDRAQIMVAEKTMAEFKRQKSARGIKVSEMKRHGKRVSVRGPRNYRLLRLHQAVWPEDKMSEDTVPALAYAYRGQVDIHIEDYVVHLPQGKWMFIPAGTAKSDGKHLFILDKSSRECEFMWMYPGPIIGIECFITHSTSQGNFVGQEYGTSANKNETLFHIFNDISKQLMDERDEEIIHYLLCSILVLLIRNLRTGRAIIPWERHLNQPVSCSRDIMAEARDHIESHLHQKLTTDKLSQILAVSPSTLKRRFRSEMNQTFNQYIIAKRMEGAEILLRDSVLSVEQVASKVGLTYPRLRTLFYKSHKCSPGEYRKRQKCPDIFY